MGWFGKLRKDARSSDRELGDETKTPLQQKPAPAQTLPRRPSTRGSDGRRRLTPGRDRRTTAKQSSRDGEPTLIPQHRRDGSVTETVSSGGASHRRKLHARRQKLQLFARSSREDITALPGSRELNISPHLRPVAQEDADIPYDFYLASASHTSMPTNPSGRATRRSSIKRGADTTPLPKRQSNKRRKDDHVREEEIRAMSGRANTGRPRRSTYDSGILRKDSKRMRGGLNRNFERPMSNVSLPFQESVHSSMSGGSDPFSYHLNRLEMFAPRPLIRQSVNGQYASGLNASMWSARADERATERRANRKPTPSREILKNGKMVDELADNLDSSDLRAVLERDQRRKEAKRQKEMEKVKRRLERKAEKERKREMGETNSPSKRKRKDLEKHLGLGIESPLLSEVEAPKRKKKDLEKHLGDVITDDKQPLQQQGAQADEDDAIRKETLAEYRRAVQASGPFSVSPNDSSAALRDDALRLGTPLDEAILLNIHPAFRPSPAQSPLPSPHKQLGHQTPETSAHERLQKIVTSPIAQEAPSSPETVEALPPLPTSPTKDATASRHSSRRSTKGWTSIFKRGPSLRKESERPAAPAGQTFSNVSRDSIQRNMGARASYAGGAAGAVVVPARSLSQTDSNVARTESVSTAATSRRDRSGTPVRTMSKFREDLPELPLSLADSNQHSSDLGVSRSTSSAVAKHRDISPTLPFPSDAGSLNGPSSATGVEEKHRSTGLMSTSLASVDSEASWISGRPVKRPSVRKSARNSVIGGAAIRKVDESATTSREDLSMADERMLKTDDPFGDHHTSFLHDEDDEDRTIVTETEQTAPGGSAEEREAEDGSLKTGEVGKTARLVERGSFVKSREGLLNDFNTSATTDHASEPTAAERSLPTPEPEAIDKSTAATAAAVAALPAAERVESSSDEHSFELPTPSATEAVSVHRADSVKVGHSHARQVSAGSAKLLDIHPPLRKPGSNASFPRVADSPKQSPKQGPVDASVLTPPPTAKIERLQDLEAADIESEESKTAEMPAVGPEEPAAPIKDLADQAAAGSEQDVDPVAQTAGSTEKRPAQKPTEAAEETALTEAPVEKEGAEADAKAIEPIQLTEPPAVAAFTEPAEAPSTEAGAEKHQPVHSTSAAENEQPAGPLEVTAPPTTKTTETTAAPAPARPHLEPEDRATSDGTSFI